MSVSVSVMQEGSPCLRSEIVLHLKWCLFVQVQVLNLSSVVL